MMGFCAAYINIAASSPVWFTRNADERKSRCSGVSGRMGLLVFDCASCETADEEGDSGAGLCAGGSGVCDVVVLWKRRGVEMRGARKSRTGTGFSRGRIRGRSIIEDIVRSIIKPTIEKNAIIR
jgi:hypothetical protein